MGQGRLFRAVGWDEQTGTHLLLSVPGMEEDTPWEQYLQVSRWEEGTWACRLQGMRWQLLGSWRRISEMASLMPWV